MRALFLIMAAFALSLLTLGQAYSVELLTSGDFETPQGVSDIPGWDLDEFYTGSDAEANTAAISGGEDRRLWLQPYNGLSTPIAADFGNFDGAKPDDVDGLDFLEWQKGNSPNGGNADDLNEWDFNYGLRSLLSNAVLSQTVPAVAGETYSFGGTSEFEVNYSGQVTNLFAASPFGDIPTPTTNSLILEFLDSNGAVLSSMTRDVRDEQLTLGFPPLALIHTPLVGQAPTNTTQVRVVAEARDMAWNGAAPDNSPDQSAFYNDLTLTAASDAGTELLTNGDLESDPPDALDFWNVATDPDPCCNGELLRTPIAGYANNTPNGTRGVWLSAFYGGDTGREEDPVTGQISQTVPIVAGETYTFAGSTKFEGNYSGGLDMIPAGLDPRFVFSGMDSPTKTEIELAFLDSSGEVIGTPAVIDVKTAREAAFGCAGTPGCANTNPAGTGSGTWVEHTLQAMAPPGAVSARITGQMIDGVNAGGGQQSAFFDDFSLDGPAPSSISSVPEPNSLVVLVMGGALLGLGRVRRTSCFKD